MRSSILAAATLVGLAAASSALAQPSITWYTIDGGGGTSTGGTFVLSGTIGQPDAGTLSGGTFTLRGGFWPGVGERTTGCQPADIGCDTGDPLAVNTTCTNNGVNEGDYNCFFSADGFFFQSSLGPAGVGQYCDIADDQGTALPPFDIPTGANNGVNEGDYNCFFNNLFLPCP
ncbi:MAG: hypothetical protein IBJ18_04555 [Phycisphaerales bacterium]|nr:hypothetical protein [Phycisphaerales bacterium]